MTARKDTMRAILAALKHLSEAGHRAGSVAAMGCNDCTEAAALVERIEQSVRAPRSKESR